MDFPTFNSDDDLIDISYSNYYTKFLSKAYNYEDDNMKLINLQRHAQVDIFYILKYKKQVQTLQHIIIICCVALVGSLLFHNGIIPSEFYTMYLGIVFAIGILLVLYDLFDIFIRNNNNFNEYDYEFIYSPPTIPPIQNKTYNSLELSNMPPIC
jgi:hypothetical protein